MLPTTAADSITIIPLVPAADSVAPVASGETAVDVAPSMSVSDLIPGVTADSIELLHKLAKGEAGQELIEALANANPDAISNTNAEYLNQMLNDTSLPPADENLPYNQGYPGSDNGAQSPQQPYYNNRGRGYSGPVRGGYPSNNRGAYQPFYRGGKIFDRCFMRPADNDRLITLRVNCCSVAQFFTDCHLLTINNDYITALMIQLHWPL